ncbi:type II secretion system protein, partial [bacterium]|nr:type II secretion system protein [bacterium]
PNLSGMLKQVQHDNVGEDCDPVCEAQHDKNWFALSQVQGDKMRLAMARKKCAFTLAEVLITLGIIGVVAALTIPTLISNNNKRIVETRLQKVYSVMNNAIELSEVENGDKTKWDSFGLTYENDEDDKFVSSDAQRWFNKYLEPYLIYNNVIFDKHNIFIYFPDGSLLRGSDYSWDFYPQAKDYDDYDDDNRELSGKKYFTFQLKPWSYKKGFEPFRSGWDGTIESLKSNSTFGCKKELPPSGRAYCTRYIMENGWKIPDDYPFKF